MGKRRSSSWIGIFVGGFIGLILFYPLFFVVPYLIWFIGKIFSSSYFMGLSCIDSCKSSTLIMRSMTIVILSVLFSSIIGGKIGFFIKRCRKDDKN